MHKMFSTLLSIYDFIFPKDIQLLKSDCIKSKDLQKLVHRVFTDTQPSFFAPLPYKHPYVHTLIYTSKYHGHKKATNILGKALAPFLAEELAERNMYEEFTKPVLIPVPLHPKKHHARGYNQTEWIAQALIKHLNSEDVTLSTDILTRVKNTPSQAHQKNKVARIQNMKDAFSVIDDLRGKDILLLDDVVTTGATLMSAKKALLTSGARNVLCVAVAH